MTLQQPALLSLILFPPPHAERVAPLVLAEGVAHLYGPVQPLQMPWDGPPFAFAGDSVQGVDRKTACCGGGPRDGNPRRVKGEKDD